MKSDVQPETSAPGSPVPAKPLRDMRGFWRILLAVIAPLPFLAKGVFYLLTPVEGDTGFRETVAVFAGNPQLVSTLKWLDVVFVVGLVPATFAVAWVARRGAPRLATAGASIALLGFLAGSLLGGVVTPALVTVQHGLDIDAMANLDQALHNEPLLGVASLLFIVGVVFGLGLLGAALWRSRVAPAWMGIALLIGGATHPFIPNHVGQGAGLVLAAVGCVGATVALLRMRNDEFDLRPARSTRPERMTNG